LIEIPIFLFYSKIEEWLIKRTTTSMLALGKCDWGFEWSNYNLILLLISLNLLEDQQVPCVHPSSILVHRTQLSKYHAYQDIVHLNAERQTACYGIVKTPLFVMCCGASLVKYSLLVLIKIDREYRVQKALQNTPVPVAKMYHYCK
jgi:hypothetical protein